MLIGIDQGTTGTTCAAIDTELGLVAEAYRELPNRYPQPGWVEQDPEEIVGTVREAVKEVLDRVGERDGPWAAGLANQGETVVAWNRETGEALAPAIVWSDTRAHSVTERLRGAGWDERIEDLTGLRLDSYFSAAKLSWLLENNEPVAQAAAGDYLALGTLDTWLAWRLAGERFSTDHSTASRTQLLRLGGDAWDPELAELFGVPSQALAAIQPSVGDWSELNDSLWSRPLPWRASLVDQPAALVGNGCLDAGDIKVTYGTGCFVLVNAGSEIPVRPEGLLAVTAWSTNAERVYALDGGAFTAGTAIRWLKQVGIIADAGDTSELAESVSDTNGATFLPALTGLGSPWWQQDVRGVFAGLSGGTTRAHLVRAVLDSIAFRVRDILEVVWAAGYPRPAALYVDGGLTRNRYLMQRQADVLGVPVRLAQHREATAIGAAALAGVGAGLIDQSKLRSLRSGREPIEPTLSRGDADAEYERWRLWAERACTL
ncbi:MAG: FGGY family carbohydrate kinase [Trueperaceae bacterium]